MTKQAAKDLATDAVNIIQDYLDIEPEGGTRISNRKYLTLKAKFTDFADFWDSYQEGD